MKRSLLQSSKKSVLPSWLHIDPLLLSGVILLSLTGLFILYSAADQNTAVIKSQAMRLLLGFTLMLVFAQIPPDRYRQWAPSLFTLGVFLLFATMVMGHVTMGAKRWLVLGPIRIQPSELMKVATPMMLAWFLSDKRLPPNFRVLSCSLGLLFIPVLFILKQPDLGTAIMVMFAGLGVLLLSGIQWRWVVGFLITLIASAPVLWHFLHTYQRDRVLTFLNPERDPLGTGYHIIQSKIAIGSGGFLGKGWLEGTQSHLSFLPEHTTDFIFAVSSEELGLIGSTTLIILFFLVFLRCLQISRDAQNTFTRLLAGSLSLIFILSAFINIGMVVGLLPVVGIPLPLVSYGGSSIVTTMVEFGIIMSIQTHKKLWSS